MNKTLWRVLPIALASSALLFAGEANAGPNLVANGTFDVDLSGWTLTGNGPDWFTGWISAAGGAYQNGNKDSVPATLAQVINTNPGFHYQVSFDFSDQINGGESFQVFFDGQEIVTNVLFGGGKFATYTFSGLVASGSTSTLAFVGFDNPNAWVVDNVSVHQTSVPGPLPIFGVVAAFGYSRKLRSRIKARNQGL
jgi:hypothetical protein